MSATHANKQKIVYNISSCTQANSQWPQIVVPGWILIWGVPNSALSPFPDFTVIVVNVGDSCQLVHMFALETEFIILFDLGTIGQQIGQDIAASANYTIAKQ